MKLCKSYREQPLPPAFYTIKHVLLTFDVFPKIPFCCLLYYTLFWGKQGVQTAPASSILHSCVRSLFLGFYVLAFLHQILLTLKRGSWNTNLLRLCLNFKPQSFKTWITLSTGQISIKRIVQFSGVPNTWYMLDNDLTGKVDNQLWPVSQS